MVWVAHGPFEPVAEEAASGWLARPVEQGEGGPDAVGGEVDLEGLVFGVVVRQVAAAQHGGGGGLGQRRRMDEAVVHRGVGGGTQVVEPAVPAEVDTVGGGGGRRPAAASPARCTSVEPVAVGVEQPAQGPVELVGRAGAQAVEGGEHPLEGRHLGGSADLGQAVGDERAYRPRDR